MEKPKTLSVILSAAKDLSSCNILLPIFPKWLVQAVIIALTTSLIPLPIAAENQPTLSPEIPIVKSAILDLNLDIPWSQVVQIQDPFEDDFLGIFDRNFFYRTFLNRRTRIDVVSLWNRQSVRILLAYTDNDCLSETSLSIGVLASSCLLPNNSQNVRQLLIKLNDQVFTLERNNNNFPISDEFATALKNAPNQNVNIRLITENGNSIDSEIGKQTVEAWKSLY